MRSHVEAVKWYEAAASMVQEDETGEFDATMDFPIYELKAKIAELYSNGEHGLDKDYVYAGMTHHGQYPLVFTKVKL